MATLSGADRIRAITDEDGMFKAFDTYPWKKDKMFQSGLTAILGDPNTENPKGTPSELATHARIFYYASRVGVTIDFNKYKDWLARHPDHTPPDILPEEYKSQTTTAGTAAPSSTEDLASKLSDLKTDSGAEDMPSWQAAAPKADLWVERKAPLQVDGADEGGEPAYPVGFAEMLQMLQKGIPIPGIRQIPDTVVRDASVKPFGKRAVPKKPWEKDAPVLEAEASEKPPVVDAEFPPLEETLAPESATATKEA
ncbi:hypothetical protein CkaCkLH20_04854 [Colletotrichum karsti]|uniref:Uncharacterized protein n=1 Tax=Colletotrichum karsti TaxID=1095194 RepID=A0A9P6I849_9PEZI|nr:uncharacterized protein CkaCkLH20_04854 [Colletotrichum karsti]KAF9877719.1 hypothetical protein CkaCkLH20_04854 [Colletotrichum karsti]